MESRALFERGVVHLEQAMLPSGGFGYHPGGQLFVEPTALALLAVAPDSPGSAAMAGTSSSVWERALQTLMSLQKPEGFFGTTPGDPDPSWTTSPALLALLAHGRREPADAAGRWLVEWRAPEKPFTQEYRQQMRKLLRIDAAIGGWPWQSGEAFATVQPTALASVALRGWGGTGATDRIAEALRYFADRECHGGGWNYGNPYVYDGVLPAITLPTAKGLLAVLLCGESPRSPLAVRGAERLSRLLAENPSHKAHAWGALAFAALGDRARAAEHAGAAVDTADGRGGLWGGTPDATALTLLALRAAAGRAPLCLTVRPT